MAESMNQTATEERAAPAAPPATSRGLPFGLSIQTLQEIAGISALGSFVFAIAATVSAAAYLEAWNIPPSLVTLNPLAALTKAGELIYTFALVGAVWVVLAESHRRTRHHRGLLALALGIVGLALIVLAFEAAANGFYGATVASIATYVLFFGLRVYGRLPLVPTILALIVVILIAAFQTGNELGLQRIASPSSQTHLLLTLRTPIAGLPGGATDGAAYAYSGLYLIFQDDQYLYVGSDAARGDAFLVGIPQIVAITVVP
jgi:hypothetical protein